MQKAIKLDDYKLQKLIGKGSYGEVYYTTKDNSNIPYATKRMKRDKVENPSYIKYFINEISILKGIFHKNIVRIETLKKTTNHYYIIMEYYGGGTLKENLDDYKKKYGKPFSEKIVQHIARQLIETVNFLHERQIVHRDLKLENILLNYNTQKAKDDLDILHSDLKLIDFGTATHISNENLITTCIGSPFSMDPLILKKYINTSDNLVPYDEKIDIWSLGVICYYLFTGDLPFKAFNAIDLLNEIEKGYLKIPINLSIEAISFLLKMFQISPEKRFRAQELLKHPFLQRYVGEFSYLDKNKFSNYIKDGYININIKNDDGINSIINQYINKNSSIDNSSFKDNKTNFTSIFGNSYFGGSAPINKNKLNNLSFPNFSNEINTYKSVTPDPQIASIIINLMNEPQIKQQPMLHNSLMFIYGNNDNLQNQSCPNYIYNKDFEQIKTFNQNQKSMSPFIHNPKNQMNFGFGNTPNNFKAEPEIKAKSSKKINNFQYQSNQSNNQIPSQFTQVEKLKQNINDASIKNKSEATKVLNSHINKAFLSGKYYSFQPQLNYTMPGSQLNYQNYNFNNNSNH